MLVTAMVPAQAVTSRPAVASLTEKDELSESNTPDGIISALTVVNVAALSASSGIREDFDLVTPANLNFDTNVKVKPEGLRMKIGELARRAGTSTRMLRYYESQGLLATERGSNGYRYFRDSDIERARTIASLVQSGLPTRLIRVVLTAEDRPSEWTTACDDEFTTLLRGELNTLEEKISCLTRSHTAVRSALERAAVNNVLASNT